jgi:hypothetical protein
MRGALTALVAHPKGVTMYGLFTRLGAGAVMSAGLSVLGVTLLCTEAPSSHHHNTPAAVAIEADAALDVAANTASPGSPSNGAPAGRVALGVDGNVGLTIPGSATNPGSNPSHPGSNPSHPGSNPAPGCGCTTSNPPLVNVKPDVDVDVDVDVKLPDVDVDTPDVVGGVLGTVGIVVDGVLPDCGCTSGDHSTGLLPLSILGH